MKWKSIFLDCLLALSSLQAKGRYDQLPRGQKLLFYIASLDWFFYIFLAKRVRARVFPLLVQ
jgi:hypothetical protein